MNKFTRIAGLRLADSYTAEGAFELGLAAAAAAFTATVWLSVASFVIAPDSALDSAVASHSPAMTPISLPAVVIIGRRDSREGAPVTTTAQNTAAIPVTLKQ